MSLSSIRTRLERLAELIRVDEGDDAAPGPLFVRYGCDATTNPTPAPYTGGRVIRLGVGEDLPAKLPRHSIRVFIPAELPSTDAATLAG